MREKRPEPGDDECRKEGYNEEDDNQFSTSAYPPLAVGAVRLQVEVRAVRPGRGIDVGVLLGVARDLALFKISPLPPALGNRLCRGFLHQGSKPLLGGGIFAVVEIVQLEGLFELLDLHLRLELLGLLRPPHDSRDDEAGKNP